MSLYRQLKMGCDFPSSFFKDFIYPLLERGEGERKRGRETLTCKRNINWLPLTCLQPGTWPTAQACALTGNQTTFGWKLALGPLGHASQG